MPNINITVKNKIATGDGTRIICGNSDYTVNFTFDSEWNAFQVKTMRLAYDNGEYDEVAFNGTSAALPVINNKNGVKIGVYAGNLHTTVGAYFDTKKSILCGSNTHVPPRTDVYNQLMAQLQQIIDENSGIKSITFTRTDAQGGNVYTILLYNGETYEITAPKGAKGDSGGGGTSDHANLSHLDYASSGHTGFASSTDLAGKVDKVEGKGLSTNDYDNTEKGNVAANTTARHSHDNKSILDGIIQTVIDAWNAASTWITTNGANVLTHIADTVSHITSGERSAWNAKADKPTKVDESAPTAITLADNTEYELTNVQSCTFAYPQTDFHCNIKLSTAASGTLTITFPTSQYIGSVPTFANGETWEIDIKDGVIVAGKQVSA